MKATHKPADVQVTPAHILRGAARYLQTNGWIKGAFFDLSMDPGPAFPPACAGGAICAAATGRPIAPTALPVTPDAANALRTLAAFAGYIEDYDQTGDLTEIGADIVADWNDADRRTFTDVKTALLDAADEWERLHPAATMCPAPCPLSCRSCTRDRDCECYEHAYLADERVPAVNA